MLKKKEKKNITRNEKKEKEKSGCVNSDFLLELGVLKFAKKEKKWDRGGVLGFENGPPMDTT